MIAWINFAVLLFASIMLLYFYVLSARPAGQEKVIGPRAYQRCFYYRLVAAGFEVIITANYILYHFFPLSTLLPDQFPWPWWISLVIALLIGIPATTLMVIGARDAGKRPCARRRNTACTAAFTPESVILRRWGKPSCLR